MTWAKCHILTTFAAIDAITHTLEKLNVKGVEIEELYKDSDHLLTVDDEVRIIFYLAKKTVTDSVINKLKRDIKNLENYGINIGTASLLIEAISDDWMTAWQKYYKPIQISEHITIIPTWEKVAHPNDHSVTIELDPGLAFGTGSHATTALCLQALEKYLKQKQTVIDVGSGSGILSIASLLLGAEEVIAVDNDPQAIKSTKQNAQLNGVEQSLTVKQGDLLTGINKQANIIIANILAEVIVMVAADAYNLLDNQGYFITSGIIKRKQQLVIDRLQKARFNIIETNESDGWVCIIAQK